MIPYWLKPNKVGVAFLIIFTILFLYVFSFFDIILVNQPLLLIAFSVSVAYPISMILGIRVGKKMKILLGVMLVVMLCLFIFSICPIYSMFFPNIGLPLGYYRKFNRVKHRLKQVSGIQIYGYHQHKDVSFEDFWFTVQTEGGLKIDLQFSHVAKTYELFDHADGLGVMTPNSGKVLSYPFGPDKHLETAIGKEIRNAVDVLENFDRIAEIVENDRQKGLPGGLGWEGIPKSYFRIIFPSYSPQPIIYIKTTTNELPKQRQHIKSLSKDIEVHLTPKTSDRKYHLNWSPYGKRHKLIQAGNGLETKIYLGPKDLSPILARLEKSNGSKNYDILKIDKNRNGSFEEGEILETKPNIRREKIWSSFKTIIDIPATDPWTGNSIINPYSMSLWYVEDPREETQDKVLRFTRRWWLEGKTKINQTDCLVLVSERKLDGIIDENDKWALAHANEPQPLYQSKHSQLITQHAWLGNNAYRIKEIHPSGRKLTIEPYDPNITKEEDLKRRDPYSEDREVPRSGKTVTFLHDFKKAEALASKENKPLFIDFEATWCGPCKTMDQLVYTADVVVKAAQNVISVKVDGDKQPELKKQFRVGGYPTMILLTSQGEELKRTSGYVGVKEMAVFLNFRLEKK